MKLRQLLLTLAVSCTMVQAFADTKTSTGSGNWTSSGTWSPAGAPGSGDVVTISAGHTVTVSSVVNLSTGAATNITVNGILSFNGGGSKLRLAGGSVITVGASGQVTTSGGGGSSQTIEAGGATIWSSSYGSFSGPATVSQMAPLPVTWVSFNAKRSAEAAVNLKWSTASEMNNSHFEVERSSDAKNFTVIGKVKGNGTTSQVSNYTYTDEKSVSSPCYYRLRQVDLNGKSNYSIIISVPASAKTVAQKAAGTNVVAVNPNPVADMAELRVKGYENVNASIQVIDVAGAILREMNMLLGTESSPAMVDLGWLKTGTYFIKVTPTGASKEAGSCKFMKQ